MKLKTNQIVLAQFVASTLLSTMVALGSFGVLWVLTDLREQNELQARRGVEAAHGRPRTDRGQGNVDEIKQTARELKAVESEQETGRLAATVGRAQWTLAFMGAGWVVSAVSVMFSLLLVAREPARRGSIENDGVHDQKLHSRARLVSAVLDQMGDGVVVADQTGQFMTFNQAAVRILGIGPLNVPSNEWPERYGLFLPDATTPFPADQVPLARALRGESADRVELFVRHSERPEGMWISVNARPVLDENGTPQGGVVVFRDTTELKRAELCLERSRSELKERVREQSAELEALMEAVPAIVWIANDTDCRRITGNRAGNEFLRIGAGENASVTAADGERPTHFRAFRDAVEIPPAELPVQLAARGVEVFGSELDVVFDDGTTLSLYGNARPVFDDGGNPCGAVSAFIDITSRRQAEAQLRASEQRFRELADAMPQIVWTAGPDGAIDYCNQRWFEITGHRYTPGAEKSWNDLIHPEDLAKCKDGWARSVSSATLHDMEYRFLHQNSGQYRWHLGRAFPVRDESGAVARWIGTSTDIDDLKRTQEALRDSESRLTLALDTAEMGIWDWDVQTGRLDWSPQHLRLFGYSDGEFNNHYEGFRRRVHPDDIDELERRNTWMLDSDDNLNWEFRVVWPDGSVHWIQAVGGVIGRVAGRASRIIGTAVDITMRKLAENELRRAHEGLEQSVRERTGDLEIANRMLRESERLIRVIFDQTFQFIGLLSADGAILEANQTALDFGGLTRDQVFGQPIWESGLWVVDPEVKRWLRQSIVEAASGGVVRHEFDVRGADARVATIDFSLKPLRDDEGNVAIMLAEGHDISERIRAENELTRINDALRRQARLIDVAHEAIIIRTIEGEISLWNEGAERLYGWSKEEALGRSTHKLLNTRFPVPFDTIMEQLGNQGSWEGELSHERADGSTIVVSSRWVIDRERWGPDCAVLEMNNDITERRRAEAEAARERQLLSESVDELVRAREATLENSRLKSEFLANMSHEIRTPMNGVIGMTSLLCQTDLDAEQRDCVMTIRDSGQALMNIINDVLDFSKIESGKLTLEVEDFNLRTMMEDVAELMAPTVHQKRLKIACEFPPSLLEWYEGDGGRIRQVLLNLVSNAAKFTAQGEIILSARVLARSAGHSTLRLAVKDTGIGIAPDRQEVIFESFTQADGSISRRYGGTGLGLSICRRLAELMGGNIGLASVPGEGSEFWLELNLKESSRPTREPVMPDAADLKTRASDFAGLRVLVAEDNTTNQKVAKRMLERLGCHADAVFNGREALSMLDRISYNVVLMDVQMPEMDGLSATVEIRRRERGDGRRLPVIAMTAHAMQGDRERCLAAGMDDYLSKPVTHDGLAEVLERWCSPIFEPRPAAIPAAPANQGRAAIFRFERLREISAGDSSCERELLQMFLSDAVAARSEIRAAFGESDAARVSAAAHSFAGACCTLGADSMAAFCRELELTAQGEKLPSGKRALADFDCEYQSLEATISVYVERLDSSK